MCCTLKKHYFRILKLSINIAAFYSLLRMKGLYLQASKMQMPGRLHHHSGQAISQAIIICFPEDWSTFTRTADTAGLLILLPAFLPFCNCNTLSDL